MPCILIFGVANMKHIQLILISCSIFADFVAANGDLSDFKLKFKLKVTQRQGCFVTFPLAVDGKQITWFINLAIVLKSHLIK